jgi:hypothetical protein
MFDSSLGKRSFAFGLCFRRHIYQLMTVPPPPFTSLRPLNRDTHVSVQLPSLDVMYD